MKDVDNRARRFEEALPEMPTDELRATKKRMTQAAVTGKLVFGNRSLDERISLAVIRELTRRDTAHSGEASMAQKLARFTGQRVGALEKHLARDRKRHERYFEMLEGKERRYQEASERLAVELTGQPLRHTEDM